MITIYALPAAVAKTKKIGVSFIVCIGSPVLLPAAPPEIGRYVKGMHASFTHEQMDLLNSECDFMALQSRYFQGNINLILCIHSSSQ